MASGHLLLNWLVKRENSIGLPAKILPSAQTQYELESTNGNVTVSDGQQILIQVIYDLSHCPIVPSAVNAAEVSDFAGQFWDIVFSSTFLF